MDRKSTPGNQAHASARRRGRGFTQAGGLLGGRIRSVSEKRGMVETRLLTHWAEIAGADIAAIARPVRVSYARDGFGATLTVLTEGAHAPEIQMQLPALRERVNACYGYSAISRIKVTQTSATGFGEAAQPFEGPSPEPVPRLSTDDTARVSRAVDKIGNTGLKEALELLGQNIVARAIAQNRKES